MTVEIARIVFAAIMSVGGVVWLVALALTMRTGKPSGSQNEFDVDPPLSTELAIESGTARLAGDSSMAARRLVKSILQANQRMLGATYKIVERVDSRVVVEKVGPLICNQLPGTYFSHAVFEIRPVSHNEAEVHYVLDFAPMANQMRKVAFLLLVLAAVVMLVVGTLIWLLVIPSQHPAVRWQVLQTLQIVHVLWPPFLPIGIYNFGLRSAKIWVEDLIANAEFVEESE